MDEGIASRGATAPTRANDTTTVVIADDHRVVREGVKLVLERELDVEVVAEAADGDGAAAQVLAHRPSILLLDLNMPGESSLDVIPAIGEISPDTRTIVVTMRSEPELARRALAAGASGYVLKRAARTELVDAIRTALAGGTYVSRVLRDAGVGPH